MYIYIIIKKCICYFKKKPFVFVFILHLSIFVRPYGCRNFEISWNVFKPDANRFVVVAPRAVERESRSCAVSRKKHFKVLDRLALRPCAFENSTGLAKRIRPQTVFGIGHPRTGKLVAVAVLVNAFAVFFVLRPLAL